MTGQNAHIYTRPRRRRGVVLRLHFMENESRGKMIRARQREHTFYTWRVLQHELRLMR